MTDAELKRLVNQGLRNARRMLRTADTSGEVLERWLDRTILRKTRVTCAQMDALIPRWEDYRNKVQLLEKALADVFSSACI